MLDDGPILRSQATLFKSRVAAMEDADRRTLTELKHRLDLD